MRTLNELIRPNILNLKPYSSARDEFQGSASVFLDANENPYNEPYNRYPDPVQQEVKNSLSELKDIPSTQIFLGNGSDEAIDLVFRIFCEPGTDNVVAIDPSYGMYKVAADINNIVYRPIQLEEGFRLNAEKLLEVTDDQTKVIFLCSPNNPSGNSLERKQVCKLLDSFDGIVVIDEAYIDFAAEPSYIAQLVNYPRLIVLQTLSKAWGAAGIRMGMAFASEEIITLFNKVKYPYNINQLSQEYALRLLDQYREKDRQMEVILSERKLLAEKLLNLPFVKKVYPSDANFLLIKVTDANSLYNYLSQQGVIVRNRHKITLCEGCLRVTIGTPDENKQLMNQLSNYKP